MLAFAKKAVSFSRTELTEIMQPTHSNYENRIHAGVLLDLMDKAAIQCANKHCSANCVTVSMDEIEFFKPVKVGDMVRLMASVNYVGNTSLIIGVRGEAEDRRNGEIRHTITSYFTVVAKDSNGKVMPVPGLVLENTEDVRRFMEAQIRKDTKLLSKVRYEQKISELDIFSQLDQLRKEKCEIGFSLDL
jgi:acyl-CoA hydrolase